MAEKTNNITLPTGDTVSIPAWASEETMNRVASYMSATNKTDQQFVKLMKGMGSDMNSLQKTIASMVDATQRDNAQDQVQQESNEEFSSKVVKASKGINKVMGFFDQADKPLTALTTGASSLVSASQKSKTGILNFSSMMDTGSAGMAALGTAGNVAIDAVLAYAGWNAAKLEQFAVAQSKIIDAGVLYGEGASAFDDIRKRTIDSGNTYTSLIDNVHQFGEGMLGLGDTMGAGVSTFTKFYAALDQTAEGLGDLGLKSVDMQKAYAEYISYSRRTGRINKDLNNSASQVNKRFIDLQIEAGAVASLTSLERSEAMNRSLQSVDQFGEAAQMTLRQHGLPGHADVLEAITMQLGRVAPDMKMMQTILDAYQREAFEKAGNGNMADFDISARIETMMPGLTAAVSNVMPGFINGLEELTRSGTASADDISGYVAKAIKAADVEIRLASQGSSADSVAGMVSELQTAAITVNRQQGNLAEDGALDQAILEQRNNLKSAGLVTTQMNNMTTRFLQLQETLTMDMETTAGMFDKLNTVLAGSKEKLQKLLKFAGVDNNNDFGGIDGSDPTAKTTSLNGNVVDNGTYVSPVLNNSSTDTAGFTGDATELTSGTGLDINTDTATNTALDSTMATLISKDMLTVSDFTDFTQIYNVENTVAQLNSLTPEMRRRATGALVDFEKQYQGTDIKLMITDGFRSNTRSNQLNSSGITAAPGGSSWHNYGLAFDALGVQNSEIIENNNGGFYKGPNSILEGIMNKHGLDNVQGVNDPGHFQAIETSAVVPSNIKTGVVTPIAAVPLWHNFSNPTSETADAGTRSNSTTASASKSEITIAKEVWVPGTQFTENQYAAVTTSKDLGNEISPEIQVAYDLGPKPRRAGGQVASGAPYIVGDQNGLDSAELFVPDGAGSVMNNTSLMQLIKSISENRLTDTSSGNIIKNSTDLSELLHSKEAVVQTLKTLQTIVKRLNNTQNQAIVTDMTNSR